MSAAAVARGVSVAEIAKFRRLQEHWWNPDGPLRTLHMFNPLRVQFIVSTCKNFSRMSRTPRMANTLCGINVLDVGCGGGILAESIARLGGNVVGIDMCAESIAVAQRRCERIFCDLPSTNNKKSVESLTYRCAPLHTVTTEERQQFDLVIASEVLEHVEDAPDFLQCLCEATKPGGILIISTMDKTLRTAISHIAVAEYLTGLVEPGTHDWSKFVPPQDLARCALQYHVRQIDLQYIVTSPDVLGSLATRQLQLKFSLSKCFNTGHYFWAGMKALTHETAANSLLFTVPQPRSSKKRVMSARGSIRFDDLGEPVQRLLKSLKGGLSEEDLALLEYVSVKDMAKIYGEMSTERHAEEIWNDLRAALKERKEKATLQESNFLNKQRQLQLECAAEEKTRWEQEALEEEERRLAEEARRQRREARRKRREEDAAAAAAEAEAALLAEQEAAEEAAAQAEEEERQKKAERRRRRREARARELQEEQDALAAEHAKHKGQNPATQKKAWEEYVASHPLEFNSEAIQSIEQKRVEHTLKAPPKVTNDLLNRTHTPKCPNCATKFATPPPEWDCPICLKRLRRHFKVWQPDDSSDTCMMCRAVIGRFSRHHCRSCGRLVCNKCCVTRGVIPSLGFNAAVKICDACAYQCSRPLITTGETR